MSPSSPAPAADLANISPAPSRARAPTWSSPAATSTTACRLKKRFRKSAARAVSLELDVRDPESIERMADAAEEAFGKIDILVNNAGMNVRKPALDVTWDDWNPILDTNLRGSFFVAQAVARRMIARGYGRIINIGSVTSVVRLCGPWPLRRQPRRHPAADHEPRRRLGQARHHRQLPRARLVQDRAEQGACTKTKNGSSISAIAFP